jgi:hypothetical protein
MDSNDSVETSVQARHEMPNISTVTFPRSDKKIAALPMGVLMLQCEQLHANS